MRPDGEIRIPLSDIGSMRIDKKSGDLIIRRARARRTISSEQRRLNIDQWWRGQMFEPVGVKAQVWMNEYGANVSTQAGERVEQISHYMAENEAGNELENRLTSTRGRYEVRDITQRAIIEIKRLGQWISSQKQISR